jgi:hypothetical protein
MAGSWFSLVHDISAASVWDLTKYYHYKQVSWLQNQKSFILFTTVLILLLPVFSFEEKKTAFHSCYYFSYCCCGSCRRHIVTLILSSLVLCWLFEETHQAYYICPFPQHFTVAKDSISLAHDAAPLTYSGVSNSMCPLPSDTKFSTRLPWKR